MMVLNFDIMKLNYMPKSIWFPDEDFEQLVTLARQAGFRVSRGRGSQLRLFVMAAANTASTPTVDMHRQKGKSKSSASSVKQDGRKADSPPEVKNG
jgi:hypothetical protein